MTQGRVGLVQATVLSTEPIPQSGGNRDVFDHILVPVDFTDKNARALDVAIQMAKSFRSRLTLLHVIETLEYEDEELNSFYETLAAQAWTKLQSLAEPCARAAVKVDQDVIFGRRAVRIVDYASAQNADLLILSSHRIGSDRSPHSLVTLSYQVSILCQCPVLLVK
jgi:nucleotide-binding universal stress UspA family protein